MPGLSRKRRFLSCGYDVAVQYVWKLDLPHQADCTASASESDNICHSAAWRCCRVAPPA